MRKRRRPTVAPIFRARLYPEDGSRLYVLVQVWPTKRDLQRHRPGGVGDPIGRGTVGTCTQLTVVSCRTRRARTLPLVAEVNLARTHLGLEVVAHEFLHAAFAWARRVRFRFARLGDEDSVNADEERLTYAHSTLCTAFLNRAIPAGLYRDGIGA